jgi:hypothetical protein
MNIIKCSFVLLLVLPLISCNDDTVNTTNNGGSNTGCTHNNSFECATPISLGIPVQDNISANDDIDMFQFTLPQDGVTEVAITNVPQNLNLDIRLYSSSQSFLASNEISGLGQSVFLLKGQKGGTGYIKIEDRDHNASSSSLYSLTVTQDISDPYELNEGNETAKLIQQNTNLEAKFRPNDDEDWYQFSTSQDGVIDINVWNIPNNINVYSRLYTSTLGAIVTSDNNGLGQSISMSVARKQGLHYLRLFDQDRDNSSSNYHSFSVFLDVSDVFEYNNEFEDAKSISLNSNYQAKIKPKNDYDYFQFILSNQGNVNVLVSNVPVNINMIIRIYRSSGGFVAESSISGNGQPVTLNVNNLQPGPYVMRIWDNDQDNFSTAYYNFIVQNN